MSDILHENPSVPFIVASDECRATRDRTFFLPWQQWSKSPQYYVMHTFDYYVIFYYLIY